MLNTSSGPIYINNFLLQQCTGPTGIPAAVPLAPSAAVGTSAAAAVTAGAPAVSP